MRGLSLFSGAGIGELALKQIIPNYRTVGYVEWDTYCQEVIRARIQDGVLDDAPIFNDIRVFNERFAKEYVGKVDWISGGFPCQPFSVAGRGASEADERNMWPATRDTISIIRPRYAFLENVPGLLSKVYIRTIFGEVAEIGYDCEWDIVAAASCGAPHQRKRWWCLAYPRHGRGWPIGFVGEGDNHQKEWSTGTGSVSGSSEQPGDVAFSKGGGLQRCGDSRNSQEGNRSDGIECDLQPTGSGTVRYGEDVANTNDKGLQRATQARNLEGQRTNPVKLSTRCPEIQSNWSVEPNVGRVANGVASRVDRLKALGNGWVPQVVKRILEVT